MSSQSKPIEGKGSAGRSHSVGGSPVQECAEVLLLDKDDAIRDGLRKLLVSAGLIVTACADRARALSLAGQKHFAVALIDVDTPTVDEGLAVLQELRTVTPATTVILLVNRQTFDLAVRGFRAGAADVFAKMPENVSALVEQAARLGREGARLRDRDRVLDETLEVHDQFLKRLMDASRKAQLAEEVARGGKQELGECLVLVVDENSRTASGLQEGLGEGAFRCVSVTNGGEAIDYATQHGFQLAVVNERLPDLPYSMVAKTLRQSCDGLVLTFQNPMQGGQGQVQAGHVQILEETQTIPLVPELQRGEQLIDAILKAREAHLAKTRERRFLQAFRNEHYEFLKRYVELKQKLSALLPRAGSASGSGPRERP
jgi:CheY-like chemotaxis protein